MIQVRCKSTESHYNVLRGRLSGMITSRFLYTLFVIMTVKWDVAGWMVDL